MDTFTFTKYFLGAYFSFVAVFYTGRLYWLKASGPHQFMGTIGSSHWLGHATFRFFRLLILTICLLRISVEEIDSYLLICTYLNQPITLLLGMLIMSAGFTFTLLGHFSLGENWSSGLNPKGPMHLIETGLYKYTRNPMYLGVLATQIGFFLALPSVFTFVCLVIGYVAIFNQVKLEERHLSDIFNQQYIEYCSSTQRWFPIRFSH